LIDAIGKGEEEKNTKKGRGKGSQERRELNDDVFFFGLEREGREGKKQI